MEAAERAAIGLQRASSPPASDPALGPAEAAREFEAYVLKLLLQEMRKTVPAGGLFGDKSMDGYRAMLDDALAQRAAEAGSFGLAEQMLRQWESQR